MPTRTPRMLAGWLVAVLGLAGCGREVPPPSEQRPPQPVRDDRRFQGAVAIAPGDTVRVEIRNLDLHPGATLEPLPLAFKSRVVLVLEAGSVTASFAGQRVEKRQGQIWSVPEGVPVSLTAGRDAASLQVIAVEQK